MESLWRTLDTIELPEEARLELFDQASQALQFHIADLLRNTSATTKIAEMVETLRPGLDKLIAALDSLLRDEARSQADAQRERLRALGAPEPVVERIVRLFELNGGVGIATLAQKMGMDPITLTRAYTKLGEALGLDWAQVAANRFAARDQWERLLTAGLARDFEQLRLEFLERQRSADPKTAVDQWVLAQGPRIDQFRRLVDRARTASVTTAPMLAQIATQARVLLGR
jgi:glutamate dehydrogenase